ncbi:MAG: DUF4125 family protein [Spirochaetes bacterium]|nr:DUF4125 family protein [Spirochaetota bacterium]
MTLKDDIIESILKIELEMFRTVPVEEETACRRQPKQFLLHRKAQFKSWSEPTLRSYHGDLLSALGEGKNLMTVKYARMDNRVPRENFSPLIGEIADRLCEWQKEMFEKYPVLMRGARPLSDEEGHGVMTSFKTYLVAELETYSDTTLCLLFRDVQQKLEAGENMSEETYGYLLKDLGFPSIEAYESKSGGESR